jgi:hypothetical protein
MPSDTGCCEQIFEFAHGQKLPAPGVFHRACNGEDGRSLNLPRVCACQDAKSCVIFRKSVY